MAWAWAGGVGRRGQRPCRKRRVASRLSAARLCRSRRARKTVWALENRYGGDSWGLCDLLDDLLGTASQQVQRAPAVRRAVASYRSGGVDLHDALIIALAAERGAQAVTYDAKAARRLAMRLLT